jgi:benzodiazapine receptor
MTWSLAIALLGAVLLSAAGGLATSIGPWYRNLRKPAWQPPDWLFGPAWTVILGLTAWSASLAWDASPSPDLSRKVVILFGINALFHFAWSPLFFRLRRPDWAFYEVTFLWSSVLALVIGVAPLSALAAWCVVPYLLWVTFAAWLNLAVVRLNGPFGARAQAAPVKG